MNAQWMFNSMRNEKIRKIMQQVLILLILIACDGLTFRVTDYPVQVVGND